MAGGCESSGLVLFGALDRCGSLITLPHRSFHVSEQPRVNRCDGRCQPLDERPQRSRVGLDGRCDGQIGDIGRCTRLRSSRSTTAAACR